MYEDVPSIAISDKIFPMRLANLQITIKIKEDNNYLTPGALSISCLKIGLDVYKYYIISL